jgi:cytochrome bd-type quinol oxidase subunit 2
MNISIKKLSLGIAAFAFALTALLVPVVPASAQSSVQNGINSAKGEGVPDQLFGDGSIFTNIVNVMLFIIGAICVIMLIFGGIRYTTSAGNSANVLAAKNTIMYALIGLVIAFLAFAVVNWVLVAITPGNAATS